MPKADPFDTTGFGAGDTFTSATVAVGSSLPVARSIDIKGGAMQVATIVARDAIPGAALARDDPAQFRQEGMLCFVDADQTTYQLQGGIGNGDWVVFGAGGGAADKTRTNDDGVTLTQGMIVAQSPATAQQIRRADPASDIAVSRPVGIVVPVAGILAAAAGDIRTNPGEVIAVRLVAALGATPLGEEIIMSLVPGEGTIPSSGVSEPVTPNVHVIQRVGIIIDPLTYDGGADRLVLVQIDFSQRSLV